MSSTVLQCYYYLALCNPGSFTTRQHSKSLILWSEWYSHLCPTDTKERYHPFFSDLVGALYWSATARERVRTNKRGPWSFERYNLQARKGAENVRKKEETPKCQGKRTTEKERGWDKRTIAIFNKVVECMLITGISELVVVGGQLLQALYSNGAEVSGESCVLCQHVCAVGHEAVNERLSPHRALVLHRKI